MYILCIRGIVSTERSIFIYLVCTLFCLFKSVGLPSPVDVLWVGSIGSLFDRAMFDDLFSREWIESFSMFYTERILDQGKRRCLKLVLDKDIVDAGSGELVGHSHQKAFSYLNV
ncbi:hypothetical protein OCU04_004805 [Sclerotinia nivalis]|uniref:Uncharacterized protein n=1 Tax=Sclerotinia nivalis TaxID=352851 RepID=A0A9X0AR70_9HELO|nr:hypothetical protein OCU04_004805 [Sclerotinia nivalis]